MSRYYCAILVPSCFLAIFLASYAPALRSDRQFGYRDAAHYYYPLYERVEREWEAGRWPLWEPEENAGVPLLGNPTAAVMYPGKLIYAALPYPWAARIYIVAHTALALCAMLALMRSLETTWVGSALAALAYAFGLPVLFQSCNIIYLVGAAWLPLGIRAIDRWVRQGRRLGMVELAVVLAMQMLGGDPQAAYLSGLAGGGYALGLAWHRRLQSRQTTALEAQLPSRFGRLLRALVVIAAFAAWFAGTVAFAQWLPKLRDPGMPTPPLRWMLWAPVVVGVGWASLGVGLLCQWRGRAWRYPLGAMLLGLAASAALAIALTAIQLFPVIEFTQQTSRAAGAGPHDIYPFSIEPYRLIEMAWPNVMGVSFRGNSYWGNLVLLPGMRPKVWVPSLYLGGFTLALALSVLSLRRGQPSRIWLSAMVLISLLGSLGEYTSPIWITRMCRELASQQSGEKAAKDAVLPSNSTRKGKLANEAQSAGRTDRSPGREAGFPGRDGHVRATPAGGFLGELGPVDPMDATPIRLDGYLRDGDGGIYWWLTTLLPGFRQFRFPAKLFTFTALGLAALAGMGWDALVAGRARGIKFLIDCLMGLTVVCLVVVYWNDTRIIAALKSGGPDSSFGPFHPDRAYAAIVRSLVHAAIVFTTGLISVRLATRRPALAGSLALLVMTADLAVANSQYVLTVPQRLFEGKPEILAHIEAAERTRPEPGPYRVHRMALWAPPGWSKTESANRVSDFVTWERETLQPKYGINLGIEYTHTIGVAELYDYEWFFSGFPRKIVDPKYAKSLGIEPGKEVVYFPRRAFDMWNTRYFVVPAFANGWRDELRAYAAFRFQSELVYPTPAPFQGPNSDREYRKWVETKDFQIFRNFNEFPRAWVVHSARAIKPGVGLTRESRADAMQEIIYADDPIWHDETHHAFDPRTLIWVDNDQIGDLRGFLSGAARLASERVQVNYPSPQTAVLEATLEHPGVVVLADVFYPGWELEIDGQPAPIYRVNRMMRGAAVAKGKHRLVFRYNPLSFRAGRAISIVGLVAVMVCSVIAFRRPASPLLQTSLKQRGAQADQFKDH
jgi:hypothetical protein